MSTKGRIIAWREELVCEVLGVLDVRRFCSSAVPESPKLPQGDLERRREIKRVLQRLVSSATPRDELPSLIETVASNMKAADVVNNLQGTDAQAFVDVLDQVWCCSTAEEHVHLKLLQALDRFNLPLGIRNHCVRSLYKMCAGHALLPTSMRLELPGDTMGNIRGWGGYGVVSKCEYQGREVAVKALLSRGGLGSQEISNVRHYW